MRHYPLLFGFRDLIAGRGFVAGVSVNGRALLTSDEEQGYWMHGVNPGGMSAGGSEIGEAQGAFRATHKTILFDIAAATNNFQEFKDEVVKFFNETSESLVAEWEEAVQEVRAGQVTADWLPRVNSDNAKRSVDVVLLSADNLAPEYNEPDLKPALAAA